MSVLKYLLEMPFSRRQRTLASERSPISKRCFIDGTASTDFGKMVASKLWDKLNLVKTIEELTPYPEDSLLDVYGLAEEDLDEDIILSLISDTGAAVPSIESLHDFGEIKTPLDVVRLIETCEIPRFG